MTLLSAYEDMVGRTLTAIGGPLARLVYVAGLRGSDGRYQHWGMARVHGEAASDSALRRAHRETLLEVLRTPLWKLSAESCGTAKDESELLPEQSSRAAAAHLSSVLLARDALAHARANSNRSSA